MFKRLLTSGNLLKASGICLGAGAVFGMNQKMKEVNIWAGDRQSYTRDDPFRRSRAKEKVTHGTIEEEILIFSGNANRPLAQEIGTHLGSSLGRAKVSRFADGEVNIQVQEHVRGKDVFIIQPTCPPVNDNLMELLLLVSTLRRSSAKRITAVIPYYGYARQDRKMASRVPISAADVARLLEKIGIDRMIAVDLHCGQIQGFFGPKVPVDNLEGNVVGIDYFTQEESTVDIDNLVIVSPDAGGVYRAKQFADGLIARGAENVGLAMIIKQRAAASQISKMDLVGSVEGKECIIVDDIIDTAGTLCLAAQKLRDAGAKTVYAFATHGLFSGQAYERILKSCMNKILITNTIPLKENAPQDKILQLPIGMLIAEAIRRIHQKESVSELFRNK